MPGLTKILALPIDYHHFDVHVERLLFDLGQYHQYKYVGPTERKKLEATNKEHFEDFEFLEALMKTLSQNKQKESRNMFAYATNPNAVGY